MIKAHVDVHIERKLTHVFGVLAMVLVHHFCPEWVAWTVLIGVGLPLILLDIARKRSERLRVWSAKVFGGVMRRREINGWAGTTFLLLGAALIFMLFPHDIVSLSLLFLAFADPLASFFGLKFGSHKLIGKKTFEGTLAAFVVCLIIAWCFFTSKNLMTSHVMVVTLLAALIGSLSELIPLGTLDDNFTQPVLNAIFLTLLFSLFGGLS